MDINLDNRLTRSRTLITGICSAGYDALMAILELEFLADGQVWQFYDVPEHVWYEWKRTENAVTFFHMNISGRYRAEKIGKAAE